MYNYIQEPEQAGIPTPAQCVSNILPPQQVIFCGAKSVPITSLAFASSCCMTSLHCIVDSSAASVQYVLVGYTHSRSNILAFIICFLLDLAAEGHLLKPPWLMSSLLPLNLLSMMSMHEQCEGSYRYQFYFLGCP